MTRVQRTKDDIYRETTAAFIALLEDGKVPWRQPWSVDGIMPSNFQSKRPYRGFNTLWLSLIQQIRGYESPYWTTNKAAYKMGHYLKDGEKERASFIILWKWLEVEDKEKPGKTKKVPMLRSWDVYNTDQFESIHIDRPERVPVAVPDALQSIVDGYPNPPKITYQAQDRAYYVPARDHIFLPLLSQFDSDVAHAETLCHELTHSTGHESRLKRIDSSAFSCREDYAKEELVAEIGASMLMQHAGIDPDLPSMAGYVDSWLKALKDDEKLIISAAQRAQKAVDHITGYVYEAEQEQAA